MTNLGFSLLLSGILMNLALSGPTYAYLDPGTGSLLIQGILGGIAGATVFIKIYWYKIKTFFKGGKTEDQEKNKE